MYDTFKTAFTGFTVKLAVAFHFIFEILENFMDQSINDLLQGVTSVLSIIFIVLKSYESYTNIKNTKTTIKTTTNVHQKESQR